jgi:hypothetical protein
LEKSVSLVGNAAPRRSTSSLEAAVRYLSVSAPVLLVWAMLAFHLMSDSYPIDRALAVAVGIVVAALAVVVSGGPRLPESRGSDVGGADSSLCDFGSGVSHHHGGGDDGGHGGPMVGTEVAIELGCF